jgi:catechol 2,3-dioxygenase-like lactoylglutathione lyase family enzyme
MNRHTLLLVASGLAALLTGCASNPTATQIEVPPQPVPRLGNFSVSLNVKDLAASRAFYEKLGFTAGHGDQAQGWLVMQSGECKIGLFQGMFERNMLTFNPGWNSMAEPLGEFDDVREIQRVLEERGLVLAVRADQGASGPGFLMLADPDGNPILIDQHVASPVE